MTEQEILERINNGEKLEIENIELEPKESELRIRKLTPKECIRLMGFDDNDYQALVNCGLSDSAIYHCAGDSIITTCLTALIGTMTDKDYRKIINDYVESIVERKY